MLQRGTWLAQLRQQAQAEHDEKKQPKAKAQAKQRAKAKAGKELGEEARAGDLHCMGDP